MVFQFQNIPVSRRMNATDTNADGYRDSEMRLYVRENFLAGLKAAGVPEEMLWAPKRVVSVKGACGSNEISDPVWLPTEWEMFGRNNYSVAADETADNQAWLEYYDSNAKRIKHLENKLATYCAASPNTSGSTFFRGVSSSGAAYGLTATNVYGCAPAFCVR